MALRYFSNAPATTLASSCTALDTTITVASVTGFPVSTPYTIIVDRGEATEEVMSVLSVAGTTLTVSRGYDSTTAFSHGISAAVVHGLSAADLRESNLHVNTNDGVHGVSGSVVGTSNTQTLTNKTLGASNTINGFTASRFMQSDSTGKLTASTKALPTGDVVGTSDSQTLTNKSLSLANNTISGTTAQFNTNLSDGDFATLAGTETLTNKTLTSPTVTTPTVTGLTLDGTNISGAWTSYVPTITGVTATVNHARHMKIGAKTYVVRFAFTTTGTATGAISLSLPGAAEATYVTTQALGTCGGTGLGLGTCTMKLGLAAIEFLRNSDGAAWGSGVAVGSGVQIHGTITYEAA